VPRPERIYNVAREALEIAVAALNTAAAEAAPGTPEAAAVAPARQYVSDGPLVAWDCEQVVVTVENTFGHQGDPTAERSLVDCLTMRAVTLGIWIVRCAPTMDDDGEPPPAETIDSNALVTLADPGIVTDAIVSAYKAGAFGYGLAVEQWQGVGPEGGLVGGVLRLRVDLTAV
jgi:hypothetical protein